MATWLNVLAIKKLIFNFLKFLLMEGKVHQVYMHADEAIIPVTVTLINYNCISIVLQPLDVYLCPSFASFDQKVLSQVCLASFDQKKLF